MTILKYYTSTSWFSVKLLWNNVYYKNEDVSTLNMILYSFTQQPALKMQHKRLNLTSLLYLSAKAHWIIHTCRVKWPNAAPLQSHHCHNNSVLFLNGYSHKCVIRSVTSQNHAKRSQKWCMWMHFYTVTPLPQV